MDLSVARSSVLVTGGASGLGRASVEALLDAGAAGVVILDLPSSAGEAVAKELAARYDRDVRFAAADVRDPNAVQAAVDLASDIGDLRVAVNCAGTGAPGKTVGRGNEPLPLESFQRIIEINLLGTFNVIRLTAARMAELEPLDDARAEERGVIVNTASVAAYDGQIGQASYAASKGGIVGMTLPIARDLASLGIRVVTIAPGLFNTPLLATLPDEAKASLGAQVPHPSRLGEPEEYGALVAHITTNPMLNGETIRLDGAIRMAPR
ncbi:MAG TPA: 3-hydroxyacyl-CoA dehydrogenase [Nocardioides sp.]